MKNKKLYQAFKELGKVVRALFLLRYIDEIELRKTIQSATNKSEEFNGFVKWLFFGGEGIIAENVRHEQRKIVKYNQLEQRMVLAWPPICDGFKPLNKFIGITGVTFGERLNKIAQFF